MILNHKYKNLEENISKNYKLQKEKNYKNLLEEYDELEENIQKNIITIHKLTEEKIVGLKINKESEIYEKFSVKGSEVINQNLVNYLQNSIKFISKERKVIVEVHFENLGEEFLKVVEDLVKENIKNKLVKKWRLLQAEKKEGIICLIVGAIIILFSSYVSVKFENLYIFYELFIIMAWVFLRRTFETLILDRDSLQESEEKLMQLYLAEFRIGKSEVLGEEKIIEEIKISKNNLKENFSFKYSN